MSGNGLDLLPLGGGALGGMLYCGVMQGASYTDMSRMGMCAAIGAASGFGVNFVSQNLLGGVLPSYSTGQQMSTLLYSAAYGFAGAAIVGYFM